MGSIEMPSGGTFGYDMQDQQTRLQLDLIDDLQKIDVSKTLDLPQLVVVGDQSTGKSSVLQAVTGIPFPINDQMCTHFATEITLRRTAPNDPTTVEIFIDPSPDETPERRKLLLAWKPKNFDPTGNLDKQVVENIFKQAENIIIGGASKQQSLGPGLRSNRLSSSTLRITRHGPKETNFTIVDIPGLVRGNETQSEHKSAKSLVKYYLSNLRSIVVVVIDVVDLERQGIIGMLNDMHDEESRVIGVINKCDTKQKQSDDWVFSLIHNDPTKSRRYVKEGWYGLRNRQASELAINDDERDKLESEFFAGEDWRGLPRDKLGRDNLKRALIKMRNKHVKRSIPDLLSEIQAKLDTCLTRIRQLGPPRTSNQEQFIIINRIATAYTKMAEGALDGRYEVVSDEKLFARGLIRSDLADFHSAMNKNVLKIPFRTANEDATLVGGTKEEEWAEKLMSTPTYSSIRKAISSYRAKEDADEVNLPVKALLWKQEIENWGNIANSALQSIQTTVDSVIAGLFQAACPDKDLRLKLHQWLQDDFAQASSDAKEELQRLLHNEEDASLFTLNPWRQELKQRHQGSRLQAISGVLSKRDPVNGLPVAASPPLKVNNISADLVIKSILANNAELVGILNTHDSLAAYYSIAMYRFVDNFALQVVERHLLGPNGALRLFTSDYVMRKLYGPEHEAKLEELAGEDPDVAQERSELDKKKDSLQKSLKRVQNFKVL